MRMIELAVVSPAVVVTGYGAERDEKMPSGVPAMRRMQVWEATMNVVAFMATPLLMPSIFVHTGWFWGIGFMLYSAHLTYQTGVIIGDICVSHPHLDSYPSVAGEAFSRVGGELFGCASNASTQRWRSVGSVGVRIVQFITYYLTGIAELIYFQQYLAQLFPQVQLCPRQWLLVAAAAALPFMQIPTFRESSRVALVVVAVVVFNMCVFLYEVVLVQPWACEPGPIYPPPSTASVIRGLAGVAYAFGGHGLFPEQVREMEQPEKWRSVMRLSWVMVLPVYFIMSLLGYYAYGANARANLNANFPRNTANLLSIVAQMVQEFYYVYYSVLALVLHVELSLGVDPTACCEWPGECRDDSDSPSGNSSSGDGHSASKDAAHSDSWKAWLPLRRCGGSPALFRFLFRTFFLGTEVLIAELLLGGEGDVLVSLQSLAGAVGYTALTYFLPLLFGWVLLPPRRRLERGYQVVSFVFCVVLMVAGVYFCTQDLVESAGAFGGDAQCIQAKGRPDGRGMRASNVLPRWAIQDNQSHPGLQ